MIENTRDDFLKTVLFGGLTVGILDGIFALVFYGAYLGSSPLRIFQSISAGLFGRESYEMGTFSFVSGIILHFLVASLITAAYWLFSKKFKILLNYPIASGLIYGMAAYLVMTYVVIPLSKIGWGKFSLFIFTVNMIGHALLVGLPIALITKRLAPKFSEN